MSVDPSHFLATSNGGKPPLLKLQNISARPELNGQLGQAVSFAAGRYVVAVLTAEIAATMAGENNAVEPSYLKLKPESLVEATNFEQLKFGAAVAFHHARLYLNSPALQQRGSYIMSLLPPPIQAKLTPEKAVLGAAIVVLLNIMLVFKLLSGWIGFTKIFVFISLIMLVSTIASPDWMDGVKAGKPLRLIAKSAAINAPTRFKQILIQLTGYRNISDRMVLGLMVAMLLWSGKILLTPSARQLRLQPPTPNTSMQPRAPRLPQYDLENIYKMGWDDAKGGKDFGTSLPDDIKADPAEAINKPSAYEESFDWAYDPPPPLQKQKSSSFGMGTILSIFTLYSFGKDLIVTPDGQLMLDPAYIMMRLRTIEPWRLGLMGMSLYRVVNAFIR
ncbi:hypothetical protein ACHAWT_009194 [Skeletonema menzelii]